MKLLRGFQQISELGVGTAATIGNFDGVHKGHQALLHRLRVEADDKGLPSLVLLFEPQPAEYFHGEQAPARLSSFREKLDVLRQCGVDYVSCLPFDKALASMAATEFAHRIIFSLLQARYVLVGEDFHFGHGRLGDITLLNELGSREGCLVESFHDFFIDHQRVSSTHIRQALRLGELDLATKLLGRPYGLCGRVVEGDGRGRQWGIPTANLNLSRVVLPMTGVFCVRVLSQGRSASVGVANLGCRPTLDGKKNVLEVHLFDVDESLYGERLHVSFLHKLRDEIKFSSMDALIAQIHLDIATARSWLCRYKREQANV